MEALGSKHIYDICLDSLYAGDRRSIEEEHSWPTVATDAAALKVVAEEAISLFVQSDKLSRHAVGIIASPDQTIASLSAKLNGVADNQTHFENPSRNHWSHFVLNRGSARPSVHFSTVERRQFKLKSDGVGDAKYTVVEDDALLRAVLTIDVTSKGTPFFVISFPAFVKTIGKPYPYQKELDYIHIWCIDNLKVSVKPFNLKGFYSFLPNKAEGIYKSLFKAEGLSTGKSVLASAFHMSNEDASLQDLCDVLDGITKEVVQGWVIGAIKVLEETDSVDAEFADKLMGKMDISTAELFDAFQEQHKHGFGKVSMVGKDRTIQYSLYYDKMTTGIIKTLIGKESFEPLLGKIRSYIDAET